MTKAPGKFRKPIKAKTFANYAKLIENVSDKNFFVSSFTKQTDAKQREVFVLKEGLEEADNKRLKKILKVIKSNQKGSVRVVPLAFAAAIVGAIIVFFAVFANPLLGRAAEKGLEAAFNGKSNVYGFRLTLIPMGLRIGAVTVADQNSPMTNLFELGKTRIIFRTQAILRGKVYIEEIRADDIQFGTPRKTSGALPGKPPKEKAPPKPKSDAPPMVDFNNFDAMALLEQEYDKLTSPKLYEEAKTMYDETYAKWQKQVNDAQKQADDLKKASDPIMKLNANSFTDVSKIPQTVQDITKMIDTTKKASETATSMVNGLDSDIKKAKALEQNARNAVNTDIAHLKSYVDLGSGAAFAALEPSIRDILAASAEKYFDYGLMALDALNQLKAQAAEKEAAKTPEQRQKEKEAKAKKAADKAEKARIKAEKKAAIAGRDVHFPSPNYPSFYLGTFAADITYGSWKGEFDVKNISSEPDFNGKPITLNVAATELNRDQKITLDGRANLSSNATEFYWVKANVYGFPVAIGDQMKSAGINGFKGVSEVEATVSGTPDGGTTIDSKIDILQAQIVDPSGILAEAVATAVTQVGKVHLGIGFASQDNKFELETNLKDLINKAMKAAAEGYAKKAMDDIEKAVKAKMSQYIDGKYASSEDLDNLMKAAKGDQAAIDQIGKLLDSKKAEFEKKAADEAKKQGTQMLNDALKGNTPSLPKLW